MKRALLRGRIGRIFDLLRTNFWLIPSAMTLGVIALSVLAVAMDERVEEPVAWLWTGTPEGARAVLSTLASSMITVAGVVFSVTMVTLALASSQFGPRLLRSFMRDRGDQIVLGTFVATFVYSIMVLRTVHSLENDTFIPHISVTIAIVLAVLSVGVLIYFIHHVATSIQANNLIAVVAGELNAAIETLLAANEASRGDRSSKDPELPCDFDDNAQCVPASADGYIQSIDEDALLREAEKGEVIIVLRHRPGDFLRKGDLLADVYPATGCTKKLAKKIKDLIFIGKYRTPVQDLRYGIHQLVEIALRALSPGINDPFTAATCLDWLGAALGRLAKADFATRCRYDEGGGLRVVMENDNFDDLVDAAFTQIRESGKSHIRIAVRLLDTIRAIATCAGRTEHVDVLAQHLSQAYADSLAVTKNPYDRKSLAVAFERARGALFERRRDLLEKTSPAGAEPRRGSGG